MNYYVKISIFIIYIYRNPNPSKVSLLNKIKQENTKLTEDINKLRKNLEYFERNLNFKNGKDKTSLTDFATTISIKEAELNECRKIMHHGIQSIGTLFQTDSEEFSFTLTESMKCYLAGKPIEEKFSYYFDKLIKYLQVI
jgi:hypothetical protein